MTRFLLLGIDLILIKKQQFAVGKMLEVGDICPDWIFVDPFNRRINISMLPIAGRFSVLIFYHFQNSISESVF